MGNIMNKTLEALENIKHYDTRVGLHIDDYDTIEKSLKALEIIKEILDPKFIERPDVDDTMYYAVVVRPKGYEPFGMVKKIDTKEKYDLLKEVLL